MFDTLMKFDKNREVLDFYATDKRATKELLIRENFRETIYEPASAVRGISEKYWESMDTG